MPPTYIIDAYNVLPAILGGSVRAQDLEGSRQALEARLRAFRATCPPGTRLVVVYDGGIVTAPSRVGGDLEIVFSRPPKRADDVVLELCRALEGRPDVHVVTSDFADIGNRIRGLRLRHVTAQRFAADVRTRIEKRAGRRTTDADENKPEGTGPEEARAWVREFGFEVDPPSGPDGGTGSGSGTGTG